MKKLILLLLTAMTLTLITALPAYAESAQPENALSIADSFDPADWSFGELDWISTFEDYLKLLDFEDEVLLKSEMDGELFSLTRSMYISELERECDVRHTYQRGGLVRIAISARTGDEAEYLAIVDGIQAVFDQISAACGTVDPSHALTANPGIFDDMRAQPGEAGNALWISPFEAAQMGGKSLDGTIGVSCDKADGEYGLTFSFGVTLHNSHT